MVKKTRIKFIIVNMSIVTIMLALIFSFIFVSSRNSLERESIQMMRNIASDPEHLGRPGDPPNDVRLPYFIIMSDMNGDINVAGGYFDLSDEAYLDKLLLSVSESEDNFGELSEYNLRFLKNKTPKGDIIVFSDITSETSTLKNMVKNLLLVGGIAFLVFLIISISLSFWAVKPIDDAWKKQKQFIADASHELKTPLTVILTNAELLNSDDCATNDRIRFSNNILVMADQMKGLVHSLLSLARIDNQNYTGVTMERFSISDVVKNSILPFEPLYFEKGLSLESDIDENMFIKGNHDQIKQVIEILLDNACKYSNANGNVNVILKSIRNKCILKVSNEGHEISAEDLKNIFKRFYRADKARVMNQSYGLGLSIASTIVEDHKGKIWAESNNGINTFTVELALSN